MNKIYFWDNTCSNYKIQIRRYRDFFIANDWKEVDKPEKADLIFIGTCAAFDILEKECLDKLREVNELKTPVVAYGCLTSYDKKKVERVHRGKTINTWDEYRVEGLVDNLKVKLKDIPYESSFRSKEDQRVYDPKKGYVCISFGCSFNCSYCPHKLGIGEMRSRPSIDIIKQITNLVASGVDTVSLIGNEIGEYGLDIGTDLPELINKILKIDNNFNLLVTQIHPFSVLQQWKEMLKVLSNPRIVDIQIPIQSTDKNILYRMGRPRESEKILDFLKLVRINNKNALFRTDILVGFPGETMETLKQTLDDIIEVMDEVTIYGLEIKENTPMIKDMTLDFINQREINKMVEYAVDYVNKAGRLVNRGGQVTTDEMKEFDLRKANYVKTKKNKETDTLQNIGNKWVEVSFKNRLSMDIDWLGVPIIQTPEDMILMQELIFKTKPDVIIDCGIAHGGSLIYYASLLELLGKGRVIGIDIDIRDHNREVIKNHPMSKRIEMIEGNSIDSLTLKKVGKRLGSDERILVCLDSNHKKSHVLEELRCYKGFIRPDMYIVVFDTVTSSLAGKGLLDESFKNNGPKEAIEEFLRENKCFEIDESYNKLYVSYNPNGYLRRVK